MRRLLLVVVLALTCSGYRVAFGAPTDTIQRIKASVVAVGTYSRVRNPAFVFSGTGFAVGDGTLVATNAHVLPLTLDLEHNETLVIALPGAAGAASRFWAATVTVADRSNDVALLKLRDGHLPPVELAAAGTALQEGEELYFTGFPIGSVLGLIPATHRAMISALTPLVIPQSNASQLDASQIRRLAEGAENIIQLDAVAYPGNSGSPLYIPGTGVVVGVINSVFVKGGREKALTQPSGITYALPIAFISRLMDSLSK